MTEETFQLHPVVDVPQSLILEAAVGLDPLDEIASRHGYSAHQTEQLRKDPGFVRRVSQLAKELRDEGITFKMRAAHAAEDLIGIVWREARSPTTALPVKLDALKTLASLGGKDAKSNQVQQEGNGVTITINIPQLSNGNAERLTIENGPAKVDNLTIPVLECLPSRQEGSKNDELCWGISDYEHEDG